MHILSALQHHGTPAKFYQAEGRKQSAGACSHHNHPWGFAHVGIAHGFELLPGGHFVDVEQQAQVDVNAALAGVNAAAHYAQGLDGAGVNGQFLRSHTCQLLLIGCLVGQYAEVQLLLHEASGVRLVGGGGEL